MTSHQLNSKNNGLAALLNQTQQMVNKNKTGSDQFPFYNKEWFFSESCYV
jgi:hypothetical protein